MSSNIKYDFITNFSFFIISKKSNANLIQTEQTYNNYKENIINTQYENELIFQREFAKKIEINLSEEYFEYIENNIEDPHKTELNSEK